MRILYHHRTLGDGAEGIHICAMVAAFRSLGHDVVVRGLAGPGGTASGGRFASRLKDLLPSAGFEAASIASNAADYLDVRRTIASVRPDFLYKRHARFDVGALHAAHRARVPTVLEVNCLYNGPSYHHFEPVALRRLAARFERRALALSDVVLAVSTPLAAEIGRISPVRPVVMPNGADPERFDPARADGARVRSRLGLADAVTVGWAGVMREWHGLELLLEALSVTDDLRLLIVGDGPARGSVERHAEIAGVRERVVITGRVPPDQMPDYIAAMDIAVVARDRTGVASPMKLLEYMSMERAILAPRLENIRDLVTQGRDALLFAPDDSADFRRQLGLLLTDATLRRNLGVQARRTILDARNWRTNAQRVVDLVTKSRSGRVPYVRAS